MRNAQNRRMDTNPLRTARLERGLTLAKVAGAIGIDTGNLSRIERGRQLPDRDLAMRLFEFYERQVPLLSILGFDPDLERSRADKDRGAAA